MMNLLFNEVSQNDISFITELYNYYIINTTATFHTNPLNHDEMQSLLFFKETIYKSFVIICNNHKAGYVFISPHKTRQAYAKTAEISVYLEKSFLKMGIGSKAVAFIEDFARKNKFHTLIATICGENETSIKLFEKNGYIKCAHYKEVGFKHDRYLDVVSYQKMLNQ
jgi:L-amino acid N-acyltransferase YncA